MSEDDEMTEVRRRSLHWLTAQEEKGELNEGQRTRLNQLRQEFAHIPTQPRGEAQERQEYKEKPRSFTDRLFGSPQERQQKDIWKQEEKRAYQEALHHYKLKAIRNKAKKEAFKGGGGGIIGSLGEEFKSMSMGASQNVFGGGEHTTHQHKEGKVKTADWGEYQRHTRKRGDLNKFLR